MTVIGTNNSSEQKTRDSSSRSVKKDQINIATKPQARDASGHFVKTTKINVKTTLTAPDGTIIKPEFEKPLVAVTINNPIKRLLYWLDQIRRHQTTTFAIKLSIPLIAIPIIIAGIFTLGRYSGISFQKAQAAPLAAVASPTPRASSIPKPDTIISRAGTLRIAVGAQTKYLLSLRNGTLLVLEIPTTIDLNKYKDKQVLVTGTLNSTTGVLSVNDIAEVQLFNPTTIHEATPGS